MKTIIFNTALALISVALVACANSGSPVSEDEAIKIAEKNLSRSMRELRIQGLRQGNNFVPAGPHSGGGPKWVIGFHTVSRDSHEASIYYVTVFPDGSTGPAEIREGAHMGPTVSEPERRPTDG